MDTPSVRAPAFPDTLDWVHSGGRRLTLADFRGKLLLLDFLDLRWVRGLHEPSGRGIGDGKVYVAETNRHRVAVVDLATAGVSELRLSSGSG